MTGALATPRYSAEDFETASIRSAAPSYISEAPSYHSVAPYPEAVPPYSPPTSRNMVSAALFARDGNSTPRPAGIGLPPIPNAPTRSIPNLNDFRIATWSTAHNNPTSRLYQSVAQRRVAAQRDPVDHLRRAMTSSTLDLPEEHHDSLVMARPLEDPYLVGEVAAARARRERLLRENGDDILIREDRQWDWFLARIRDQEERERSPPRIRREPDMGQRKKLLRRIGGRRLL